MIRWTSGIVVAILVILLLLYVPQEGIQGTVVLLAMIGLWEYFKISGVTRFLSAVGVLLGGTTTALLIFWAKEPDQFLGLMAANLMLAFLLHFRGGNDFAVRLKSVTFYYFGIMYVGIFFAYWGWVRALPNWTFWVFLMLGGTFLSDVGGYVFGHWIGRHKLAPHLSPGKTIEGMIGGWIFTLLGAFLIRQIFWSDFPAIWLIMVATCMAFIGPMGDLSESLLKRGFGVKDSGQLIPGHGGLLDRVDALLFNGPVVYYFAKYFS